MPELPEVDAVRRELDPVMRGARFRRVRLRRPDLRQPFPQAFADRLRGRVVRALTRRGKYLLAALSSRETLIMHLGMTGSFRVCAPADEPDPHDHVVFEMSSGAVIAFNDPRRFGVMDLVPDGALDAHPALGRMGPEPLSPAFDAGALARACAGRRTPLKLALLDQRVVAGLGNIYASEALHLAHLSPRQRAASIATRDGRPRDGAHRLAAAVKIVLGRAIERQSRAAYRGGRFRVYDREGERCLSRSCRGTIVRFTQGGRSTFYCPVCQRASRVTSRT
jgi:formamidopyrimidine-DNA glycosylase